MGTRADMSNCGELPTPVSLVHRSLPLASTGYSGRSALPETLYDADTEARQLIGTDIQREKVSAAADTAAPDLSVNNVKAVSQHLVSAGRHPTLSAGRTSRTSSSVRSIAALTRREAAPRSAPVALDCSSC